MRVHILAVSWLVVSFEWEEQWLLWRKGLWLVLPTAHPIQALKQCVGETKCGNSTLWIRLNLYASKFKMHRTYRTQRGSGVAAQQVLCQHEFFSDRTSADSFSVLAKQDVWALSFVVARRKPSPVLSLAHTTLIFVHYFDCRGNFHESLSHIVFRFEATLCPHISYKISADLKFRLVLIVLCKEPKDTRVSMCAHMCNLLKSLL